MGTKKLKIDGKEYKLYSTHKRKHNAKQKADSVRDKVQGRSSVRVKKTKGGYGVFTRGKNR